VYWTDFKITIDELIMMDVKLSTEFFRDKVG